MQSHCSAWRSQSARNGCGGVHRQDLENLGRLRRGDADKAVETARKICAGLAAAHRKWATGIYALWYPIKGRSEPDAFAKSLRRPGIAKMLRAELTVSALSDPSRLNGCGLILVNPPWTLENELSVLLPALAGILGRQGKGAFKLDWLTRGAPQAAR